MALVKGSAEYYLKLQKRMLELAHKRAEANEKVAAAKRKAPSKRAGMNKAELVAPVPTDTSVAKVLDLALLDRLRNKRK